LIDLRSSEFLRQIDELYSTVFSLYEKNVAMLQEKTDLEKKLMSYEQWKKETARYELYDSTISAAAFSSLRFCPRFEICRNKYPPAILKYSI